MLWSRIVPEVHCFARLDRPLDVLVLHVGGNDFAVRSMLDIMWDLKSDFLRLRVAFPERLIV